MEEQCFSDSKQPRSQGSNTVFYLTGILGGITTLRIPQVGTCDLDLDTDSKTLTQTSQHLCLNPKQARNTTSFLFCKLSLCKSLWLFTLNLTRTYTTKSLRHGDSVLFMHNPVICRYPDSYAVSIVKPVFNSASWHCSYGGKHKLFHLQASSVASYTWDQ